MRRLVRARDAYWGAERAVEECGRALERCEQDVGRVVREVRGLEWDAFVVGLTDE